MSFVWPPMLLTILLVPLGVWLYRTLEGRRRRRLAALGSLGVPATPPLHGRARAAGVLPAALIVAGLALMAIALARPQAVVALPQEQGIVVLAFDVSDSMAATDLQPSRIEAAKAAAKDFIARQPASILIGVVAFSDSGVSVQQPTNDQGTILAAINRLQPQRGTSVGQGISASLSAIDLALNGTRHDYYTIQTPAPTPTPTPVPAGVHAPAAIVLLSDGENNENPDPLAAAQTAADRGVRIYTVGIGTAAGTSVNLNGFRVHTQLDEQTLQQIAQTTGGTYFDATNAQQLQSIYGGLDTQLVAKPQMTELTSLLAGASLLLLVCGASFSLFWSGRLP